jgi:hypothetical protein
MTPLPPELAAFSQTDSLADIFSTRSLPMCGTASLTVSPS